MAARRFLRNRVSVFAAAVLFVIIVASLLSPIIARHDPDKQYRREGLRAGMPIGPTDQFWLGTDGLGRDMFSRLLYGARVSLGIGLAASALAVVIGVLVGSTAGLLGGWVDAMLMRIVDVVISLPSLFIILLFVSIYKPGLFITIAVIALLGWASVSRVFRAEVIAIRERDFITAARSLGASLPHIFGKHILPHLMPLILVSIGLSVPAAIFAEASLSFLGLGVPPPTPTWGGMMQTGIQYYRLSPAQVLLPGMALVTTVVCFNLLGSGLRDALDPSMRNL